jgi:tetratricopeptide (TPR) repeat protein
VPASGRTEGRKTIDVRLRDYPLAADIPVFHLFPAEGLPPDYYQIEAVLLDGQERAVATSRGPFIISTQPAVGHPIARMKGFPPENRFLYFGMLAQQAAKTNDRAKADAYYKQALSIKPDFTRGWADYAQFLLRTGRYDQAMEAAERFKDDGQIRFEYLALRGRALKEKGTYAEAVKCLLEANKIYNSDTELLKTLGFCFYKLGQKKEALDSLNAALRLNSGLADVKALIAEVEKSLK